jgi:hypothetical protein
LRQPGRGAAVPSRPARHRSTVRSAGCPLAPGGQHLLRLGSRMGWPRLRDLLTAADQQPWSLQRQHAKASARAVWVIGQLASLAYQLRAVASRPNSSSAWLGRNQEQEALGSSGSNGRTSRRPVTLRPRCRSSSRASRPLQAAQMPRELSPEEWARIIDASGRPSSGCCSCHSARPSSPARGLVQQRPASTPGIVCLRNACRSSRRVAGRPGQVPVPAAACRR